ncbi:GroES-like protein, partial [Clathrospora elynae]
MKAITVSAPGAPPQVSYSIPIPSPGPGQILVKTRYVAVNPVDAMISQFGSPFIPSWPLTPGCDASGIVVRVGQNAVSALGKEFNEGDEVCGCTRVGWSGFTAWGEYFLFDAHVCIPIPPSISLAAASGMGVGILSASLGIFSCLSIPLPDPARLAKKRGDWALVCGGAGNVGLFAVQLLKLCGFKVVATCSERNFGLVESLGADATISSALPHPSVVSSIQRIIATDSLIYAFDATSMNNTLISSLFSSLPPPPHPPLPSSPSSASPRLYTTTNSWDPLPQSSKTTHPFIATPIQLGPIGRPEAVALNGNLRRYIPVLYQLLESGKLVAGQYSI